MLLVLAVCASPVIASYLLYYVFPPQGRTNYGALIEPPRLLPAEMALRTLEGTAVAPASLHGQWLLVVVGPSTCDAACERQLLMQRQLREMLGRERDRLDKLWLITDGEPLRAPLRAALEATPATTMLLAPREQVARWLEPAAGHALEQHLYLVDPRGHWIMRMPADAEPARVKRDLDRLLRANASWDQPGRQSAAVGR
jgi:cytochrome oxidase Cu insertion factor (SCO1/SenC/PrrC family)